MNLMICNRCKKLGRKFEKPLYEFPTDKGKRKSPCKKCRSEAQKEVKKPKKYSEIYDLGKTPKELRAIRGRIARLPEVIEYDKEYKKRLNELWMDT